MPPSMRLRLFFLWLILIVLAALGRADNIIDLNDKTFDSVYDAFGHKPMLILAQGGDHRKNNVAIESFRQLSDDRILRENGVMLVTIDANNNQMLRARMGINAADLPSLLYLYNDHLYRYQGDLSMASHMRSYALKGYENNSAEQIMSASLWLYLYTIYLEFLYNNNSGRLNLCALLLSSVVVGMLVVFAFAAIIVSISSDECEKKKKVA
mmetsp:Transcript_16720/g.25256  ORF Transcript_16720/g.25256 Transcript_16720/m.25256 type:complete len:210 (+) Transcript_16720:43-672(+)